MLEEPARRREAGGRSGGRARGLPRRRRAEARAARQEQEASRQAFTEAVGRMQRETRAVTDLLYPTPAPLPDLEASVEPGAKRSSSTPSSGRLAVAAVVIEATGSRFVLLAQSPGSRRRLTGLDAPTGDREDAADALRAKLVTPLGSGGGHAARGDGSPMGWASATSPSRSSSLDQEGALVPSGTGASASWPLVRRASARACSRSGDPAYRTFGPSDVVALHRGFVDPRSSRTAAGNARGGRRRSGRHKLLGGRGDARPALATRRRGAGALACRALRLPRARGSRGARCSPSLALSRDATATTGSSPALEIYPDATIPADLVVLSACETGRGKVVQGRGDRRARRARFMYAGAPRVLCSLWKVDDEATRALMTKFYELWNPDGRATGLGAAAALKAAQAFVRGHEKWRHPYYWAAWVLWGLPR